MTTMKAGSSLEKILAAGHFAATGELGPPQSADPEVIREKAGYLKGYVDSVNITDNQTAVARMASMAVGAMLLEDGAGQQAIEDLRDASASLKTMAQRLETGEGLMGELLDDTEYEGDMAQDLGYEVTPALLEGLETHRN